jgi:hypothetical protein
MSPREKQLLILFSIAGLLIIHVIGYNYYETKSSELQRTKNNARQALSDAKMFRDRSRQVADEMEWLAKHEPEPAAALNVQNSLQQFAEQQATRMGLTIKRQKLPTAVEDKTSHYSRAKIEFILNGKEDALYQWLDSVHSPDQFRAVTSIRMSPDRDDDTKIDCTVEVDQWFVPQAPSA